MAYSQQIPWDMESGEDGLWAAEEDQKVIMPYLSQLEWVLDVSAILGKDH